MSTPNSYLIAIPCARPRGRTSADCARPHTPIHAQFYTTNGPPANRLTLSVPHKREKRGARVGLFWKGSTLHTLNRSTSFIPK